MYFRCTDCYAATWVQELDRSAASQTLKCRRCDRGFTVQMAGNLEGDPKEQYETALALAKEQHHEDPEAEVAALLEDLR